MGQTQADGVMGRIRSVESGLDELGERVAGMKRALASKAATESDTLMGRVREMATDEARSTLERARADAESESARIRQDGEARLAETQSRIDANFGDAVDHAVSRILAP
ncbi:MAG: hypothetical protein OXU86_06665 [Thaumarchaeota archaeon]|nr:hypothetical protein [Nitrososphaerota archaeon]RNJ71863.1 MAG: hypothetical protein EB824_06495 [Thaumarchaeota archaeon S15]RNJ73683.1 MAG: hypothetical protein EB832_01325 [Thaumarchaeota archaeon S14]MDD9814213.1 hypothetical protein [Nitrososphaerota archaeon]MDD9826431.1 hypothetical protein [Nitrososphaerota archaeon]